RVGGLGERPQPRVVAGAAVVERGCRDVADPRPAARLQAVLPLLLVARGAAPRRERPEPLEGAPPDRHVRAPGVRGVDVVWTEVEERDRRALAPAHAKRVVLEAREDRAGEDVDVGVLARRAQERLEPAGPDLDVVVDEDHELAA